MLFDQGVSVAPTLQAGTRLQVQLMAERVRLSVRFNLADFTELKKASGLKLPRHIGKTRQTEDMVCYCLGPDEWYMVAMPAIGMKLKKNLLKLARKFPLSVSDISHRQIGFELSGSAVEAALSVGCALDMSVNAFPVGYATRSVFESVPVLIIRTDKTRFLVECWRSYGPYLHDFWVRAMCVDAAAFDE